MLFGPSSSTFLFTLLMVPLRSMYSNLASTLPGKSDINPSNSPSASQYPYGILHFTQLSDRDSYYSCRSWTSTLVDPDSGMAIQQLLYTLHQDSSIHSSASSNLAGLSKLVRAWSLESFRGTVYH